MIDINFVRENPEAVKADIKKRHNKEQETWVDEILTLDTEWKKYKKQVDELRAERNTVSKQINEAKKEGKDAEEFLTKAKEIPAKIEDLEFKAVEAKDKIKHHLLHIKNISHEDVPEGGEENNKVLKEYGDKKEFKFEPKGHADLLDSHPEWADLERAANVTGARWYFLKGELALLEMAVTRYAIDFMMGRGYNLVVPPFMLNREAYEGVVSLDAFEEALYKIEDEELYMIATSEHPLTAQYRDTVLDAGALPLKIVGYSTNFRKEAGSHGKDTKGIFRVHQFNKIEQIIICKPEDSWEYHKEITKNMIDFFETLDIPFQTVLLAVNDASGTAAMTIDLELWYPQQNEYREIGSSSNCTSYQTVRSNIRCQEGNERKYAHSLNSTCVATSRALCAIMENFQNEDGSVNVPAVLQKYMNGLQILGKK